MLATSSGSLLMTLRMISTASFKHPSDAAMHEVVPMPRGAHVLGIVIHRFGPRFCHINNSQSGAGKSVNRHFYTKTWTRRTHRSQMRSQIFLSPKGTRVFRGISRLWIHRNRSQVRRGKRFRQSTLLRNSPSNFLALCAVRACYLQV